MAGAVLGRSHSVLRRLRAIRRSPGQRRAEGVYLAEGRHLAAEALDAGAPIELVLYSARLETEAEGRGLLQRIRDGGVPRAEASPEALDGLQDARSPQPIVTVVRLPAWSLDSLDPPGDPMVVVVHGIQDPGNLGAIARTAHAAGALACFITGESADLFHPRTVRASMGSIFRLPLLALPIDTVFDWMARHGAAGVAADPAAETAHHAADLRGAIALFLGAEGQGLPAEIRGRLDRFVRIPMRAEVDSLSVGAAAAVLLFEAARQRESKG